MSEATNNAASTTPTPRERILASVKSVLDVTDSEYDAELGELIDAAAEDLRIAGVLPYNHYQNPMVRRYIQLYCRANFKAPPDYDRIDAARDDLLKRLSATTGYTDFEGAGT